MQLPDRSHPAAAQALARTGRSRWPGCLTLGLLILWMSDMTWAQAPSWSMRVADAVIAGPSAANDGEGWGNGLELEGVAAAWYNTADGDYFRYVRKTVDGYLDAHPANAQPGPLLAGQILFLYRVTLAAKYYDAARQAQQTLLSACTAPEAFRGGPGFECGAQPFLAEYASVFQRPQDFASISGSLKNWYGQVDVAKGSGVGVSASASMQLARLAWSLVESLESYPAEDSGRAELIAMLGRVAEAATHQLDSGGDDAATLPAKCLFIFALKKGVRRGYLSSGFSVAPGKAWQRIAAQAMPTDQGGAVRIAPGAASGAPQGESALRGALLLAATEADHRATAGLARGETVLLDAWYNSQQRKNAAGQDESFHYKWSDFADSGYALLGHMFRSYGASTATLASAPTPARLRGAQFYIIVSPDIPVKNPQPHYMTEKDADQIAAWVRQGGVLAMLENDPPNADIDHLNLLADRFGIHFDNVLHHHILGEHVEDGRIPVAPDGMLFHHPHTLYMKDTCAISLRPPATALLRDRGDVVMAAVKFGRGTVFAAVDPWVYNEYTDGRKNPLIYKQFDNFAGGEEFVRWLLEQHLR